jgi:hypothetical protein
MVQPWPSLQGLVLSESTNILSLLLNLACRPIRMSSPILVINTILGLMLHMVAIKIQSITVSDTDMESPFTEARLSPPPRPQAFRYRQPHRTQDHRTTLCSHTMGYTSGNERREGSRTVWRNGPPPQPLSSTIPLHTSSHLLQSTFYFFHIGPPFLWTGHHCCALFLPFPLRAALLRSRCQLLDASSAFVLS